jgi:hypothetical protein
MFVVYRVQAEEIIAETIRVCGLLQQTFALVHWIAVLSASGHNRGRLERI